MNNSLHPQSYINNFQRERMSGCLPTTQRKDVFNRYQSTITHSQPILPFHNIPKLNAHPPYRSEGVTKFDDGFFPSEMLEKVCNGKDSMRASTFPLFHSTQQVPRLAEAMLLGSLRNGSRQMAPTENQHQTLETGRECSKASWLSGAMVLDSLRKDSGQTTHSSENQQQTARNLEECSKTAWLEEAVLFGLLRNDSKQMGHKTEIQRQATKNEEKCIKGTVPQLAPAQATTKEAADNTISEQYLKNLLAQAQQADFLKAQQTTVPWISSTQAVLPTRRANENLRAPLYFQHQQQKPLQAPLQQNQPWSVKHKDKRTEEFLFENFIDVLNQDFDTKYGVVEPMASGLSGAGAELMTAFAAPTTYDKMPGKVSKRKRSRDKLTETSEFAWQCKPETKAAERSSEAIESAKKLKEQLDSVEERIKSVRSQLANSCQKFGALKPKTKKSVAESERKNQAEIAELWRKHQNEMYQLSSKHGFPNLPKKTQSQNPYTLRPSQSQEDRNKLWDSWRQIALADFETKATREVVLFLQSRPSNTQGPMTEEAKREIKKEKLAVEKIHINRFSALKGCYEPLQISASTADAQVQQFLVFLFNHISEVDDPVELGLLLVEMVLEFQRLYPDTFGPFSADKARQNLQKEASALQSHVFIEKTKKTILNGILNEDKIKETHGGRQEEKEQNSMKKSNKKPRDVNKKVPLTRSIRNEKNVSLECNTPKTSIIQANNKRKRQDKKDSKFQELAIEDSIDVNDSPKKKAYVIPQDNSRISERLLKKADIVFVTV